MTAPIPKPRILVVDDNPENIWPLIEDLEEDYEVLFAVDGEKALHLAYSPPHPDLILLDIQMPGMDGYEVCTRLKADEHTREIPIIFLTGKTEQRDETKGLKLGAQDYITKPFSLAVVRARIKGVLNLKKELDRRQLLWKQLEQINIQLEKQIEQKMTELKEARETLLSFEKKYRYLFQPRASAQKTETILIVDDNPENIHILIENLESHYQVTYATDGRKALKIAASQQQPDLILLDIMMPGMDGYEVCSRLKANPETRDIPVIFVTALGQEMEETKGLQLGAVDFVTKPFSMPVVEARVKTALRLKQEMDGRMALTYKLEELNRNLENRVREKTEALEQAHEDLKEGEKKYRNIYENALEGIFQTTPEGQFLNANTSLAKILGYESATDLMSANPEMGKDLIYDPEDWKQLSSILGQKTDIRGYEIRVRKKNGAIIWGLLCARVIPDESDRPFYFQGFLVDISERKEAEERIRQFSATLERRVEERTAELADANQELESFSYSVSHDLRTPLRAIDGFAKIVSDNCHERLDEEGRMLLNKIQENTKKMNQLINDLLTFSRIGRTELGHGKINMEALTREVFDELRSFVPDRRLNIDIGPLVPCMGDAAMIRQLLVNLLSNAIKFTSPRETGEIEVRCRPEGDENIYSIRDNGVGFNPQYSHKLFNVFQRLHSKNEFEGTGIGLALVKRIIKRHGGRVWAQGKEDKGACFYFTLPRQGNH